MIWDLYDKNKNIKLFMIFDILWLILKKKKWWMENIILF